MYILGMSFGIPTIQYGFLDQPFPAHSHACWEIHLITAGRGFILQDGDNWSVSNYSLTLSPPGHAHELKIISPLSFYYIQFSDEKELSKLLVRLFELQSKNGPFCVEAKKTTEADELKGKLDSTLPDRITSGVYGFRAWMYDLVTPYTRNEEDQITKVLHWLRNNLGRRIELKEMASVAGLEFFTFCRQFKLKTGLSPLAYVHRSKIEAASFLLEGTELSLAEIAFRFGFTDEFHFGKVFKKWRGVPPGQWRRELLFLDKTKKEHN